MVNSMKKFQLALFAAALSLPLAHSAYANPYLSLWIGATNPDASDYGSSSDFGVLGGYQITDNLAIEGGIRELGDFSDDDGEVKFSNYELAVVGILPLSELFGIYGRLGYLDWEANVSGTSSKYEDEDDGTEITYGVGFMVNAIDQGRVKFEYSEYDIDSVTIGYVGAGFEIHF
jgi:hypothetical protein